MAVPGFFFLWGELRVGETKLDISEIIAKSGPGEASDVLNHKSSWLKCPDCFGGRGKHVSRVIGGHGLTA